MPSLERMKALYDIMKDDDAMVFPEIAIRVRKLPDFETYADTHIRRILNSLRFLGLVEKVSVDRRGKHNKRILVGWKKRHLM